MKNLKRMIADKFIELCSKMPIEKVTITLLVEKVGISKPTFYNHFKDKYDLIGWIYYQDLSQNDRVNDYLGEEEDFLVALKNIDHKRSFYKKALSMNDQNNLYEIMHNYNMDYNTNALKSLLKTDELPMDLKYAMEYHSYGGVNYLIKWLKEENPMSPEELSRLMYLYAPSIMKEAWNRKIDE